MISLQRINCQGMEEALEVEVGFYAVHQSSNCISHFKTDSRVESPSVAGSCSLLVSWQMETSSLVSSPSSRSWQVAAVWLLMWKDEGGVSLGPPLFELPGYCVKSAKIKIVRTRVQTLRWRVFPLGYQLLWSNYFFTCDVEFYSQLTDGHRLVPIVDFSDLPHRKGPSEQSAD